MAEHRVRRGQQRIEVEPDQGRRHQSHVRERRISAADVGRVEEDLAQVVVVGDRLDALAGVGDGHHHLAGLFPDVGMASPERLLHALPGVGLEGLWFRGRARLRGHGEQGRKRIEVVYRGRNRFGIGRVQDPQSKVAVDRAKRPMENLGRQAAATHPGHDCIAEPGGADAVAEAFEGRDLGREMLRRVQPAEALRDGGLDARIAGPQASVAIHQPFCRLESRARFVAAEGELDGGSRRGRRVAHG